MVAHKTRRRGRPAGQTKASGANVSPGRPRLGESEQRRYAHWLAWWATRPGGLPSARALAGRMQETARTVQAYAAGTRNPTENALCNLESLSAANGFEPLTGEHQVLG